MNRIQYDLRAAESGRWLWLHCEGPDGLAVLPARVHGFVVGGALSVEMDGEDRIVQLDDEEPWFGRWRLIAAEPMTIPKHVNLRKESDR